MRKVIVRLIPFIIAMYFINYLDRTNLGIAGPGGMNEDLAMNATQFGFAAGIFFFGYLILEVPSNLALHRFGARIWLARILISWGVVAGAMAFVPNHGWLYVLRFLLGVAEAGFFPGIILYLTYWFPTSMRARATALFMLAIPLSSVIGTPLSSWLISSGDAVFEAFAGWRFMFIIEGVPAILLGIMCLVYLTDHPRDAKWLAPEERDWLQATMDAEEKGKSETFHYPVRRSLLQPRVWALAFVYFGMVYGLYAMSFFLPTIISGFQETFGVEYSIVEIGVITAIPYVFGALRHVLLVPPRRSDERTRVARGDPAVRRRRGDPDRPLPVLAFHDDDRRDHHLHGDLRGPADVLAPAADLPRRCRCRRRARPHQLAWATRPGSSPRTSPAGSPTSPAPRMRACGSSVPPWSPPASSPSFSRQLPRPIAWSRRCGSESASTRIRGDQHGQ
jgi:MFS family permease